MGGAERVARQRSLGKLPVRERLDLLLDPGTFVEYGQLADHMDPAWPPRAPRRRRRRHRHRRRSTAGGSRSSPTTSPCMAGSMGEVGEHKTARMRELVLRQRIPIVWLLDSGGARIQSTTGSTFAGAGALFREQVTLSGVVPQVGGDARSLRGRAPRTSRRSTDFIPMVKGTSSMALGGRHLVKAATGEDVTEEEMGGSEVHNKVSPASPTRRSTSDEECLAMVRALPLLLPDAQHRGRRPVTECDDPVDRRCEELYDIVPDRAARGPTTRARSIERRRRRRRLPRDQAAAGPATSSPRSPASAASPSGSSPTSRWCSAAPST